MSIINNAGSGSSILIVSTIDQYLIQHQDKNINLDLLKQHLRPDTLPKSEGAEERFKKNLEFWLKYGLWKIEGERIYLAKGDEQKPLEQRLLRIIIDYTKDEVSFFEGNDFEVFILYITCLIHQDRYSFVGGDRLNGGTYTTNIPQAIHQYADLKRVPNQSNESGHLIKWAEFLGFLEPDNDAYFLDPTRAILPYLKEIFAKKSVLSIQTFMDHLAIYLPMFGTGRFNQYIAQVVHTPQVQEHQMSAAVSHALLRLEMMNNINLVTQSDDVNALQLYLPQGMQLRTVSTIEWRGEA